jgi:hypothetical protein
MHRYPSAETCEVSVRADPFFTRSYSPQSENLIFVWSSKDHRLTVLFAKSIFVFPIDELAE